MSLEWLKNPSFRTQQGNANNLITNALALEGQNLPCHVVDVNGPMITVAFDVVSSYTLPQVTIPIFGPEYIRYPIQIGDLGVTRSADASLGYTSGLDSQVADITRPSPLEALYFQPIGSKKWVSAIDANSLELYGPSGVIIHDTASNSTIRLTTSEITLTRGSTSIVMDGTNVTVTATDFIVNAPTITLNGQMSQGTGATSYAATLQGPITVVHELTANGIPVSSHIHGGVQSGSSNTATPSV